MYSFLKFLYETSFSLTFFVFEKTHKGIVNENGSMIFLASSNTYV